MLAVKTILTTLVAKNYKVRKPANVVRLAINYHMLSGGWCLIGQPCSHRSTLDTLVIRIHNSELNNHIKYRLIHTITVP